MLKGLDISLQVIKCDNKTGTDKLRAIHTKINDILYGFTYKYISPKDAESIYTSLANAGVELKALEVPQAAQAKKEELLTKLRAIVINVNNYRKTVTLTEADAQQVSQTVKYYTAQYLKAKENKELTDEKIMELLKEHKRITDNLVKPSSAINPQMFNKIPRELFDVLEQKYNPNFSIAHYD